MNSMLMCAVGGSVEMLCERSKVASCEKLCVCAVDIDDATILRQIVHGECHDVIDALPCRRAAIEEELRQEQPEVARLNRRVRVCLRLHGEAQVAVVHLQHNATQQAWSAMQHGSVVQIIEHTMVWLRGPAMR